MQFHYSTEQLQIDPESFPIAGRLCLSASNLYAVSSFPRVLSAVRGYMFEAELPALPGNCTTSVHARYLDQTVYQSFILAAGALN